MMKHSSSFFRVCGISLSLAVLPAAAAEPTLPKDTLASAASVTTTTAAPIELFACCYGCSRFPENFAFQDGRKDANVDFAWSFYVARSGTEVTLIDTGFSGPATAKQWHVNMTREPSLLLADLKINPAQVTRILITHIHFDHVSNLPLFPNAQVFISRRDRDDYVNKKPLGGVTYDPLVAAILSDPARTHVIDERETLPGGFEVEVVGGHTAGSSVVHLHHEGIHHVLAGDECYLCANLTEQRPIGHTVDLPRNLALLHRLTDPAIVILPCHDPGIFTRFPAVGPGIARIFGPQP
jgi:glyoxylase-like metal-dependent hydrolase (beta-lactamase superfamily II)